MRNRTRAREFALQSLYQMELNTEATDYTDLVTAPADKEIISYADQLVKGVRDNQKSIDDSLTKTLTNWDINRLDVIDRAILRLATYELFYVKDIPKAVVINEAVELAKKYGTKESSVLINGVLDKIKP
ncbi:MAG: transcription antitermination factor NusB [Planctomycetes bacterium]|nr:transcription antitermination factor NusB [Planctomycetota bacterium]